MNTDLLHAKQLLSARHLSLGFRSGVVGRMPTISVAAAVSSAARNVHAVGIGRKVVEGKTTRELSVRLYVVQKLAKSLLPPRDLLPETIDGVPVDVIEFESGISDGAGEPLTLPGEPGPSLGTASKCGCSGGRGRPARRTGKPASGLWWLGSVWRIGMSLRGQLAIFAGLRGPETIPPRSISSATTMSWRM